MDRDEIIWHDEKQIVTKAFLGAFDTAFLRLAQQSFVNEEPCKALAELIVSERERYTETEYLRTLIKMYAGLPAPHMRHGAGHWYLTYEHTRRLLLTEIASLWKWDNTTTSQVALGCLVAIAPLERDSVPFSGRELGGPREAYLKLIPAPVILLHHTLFEKRFLDTPQFSTLLYEVFQRRVVEVMREARNEKRLFSDHLLLMLGKSGFPDKFGEILFAEFFSGRSRAFYQNASLALGKADL